MSKQSYSNHKRLDPAFHFTLFPLTAAVLIMGVILFAQAVSDEGISLAVTAFLLCGIALLLLLLRMRLYGLKLQDRLIRSEENFRYYVLTGQRLDPRLTSKQIIALRFASDEEFVQLAKKAVEQKLTPDQIKGEVKQWRTDEARI